MSDLKTFFANSFLIVLSVLFTLTACFLAGEAYYRIKIGGISIDPPVEWFKFHKDRGWALVPGQYSYFHFTALREVTAEINSLGTRNPPLTLKPAKNRISIVGDSFAFADALNEDEKFTSVIQQLSGDRAEIVNISVPGYGTGQQLLFLNELNKQGYDPGNKIVLVFFTNDIMDNVGLDYSSATLDSQKPAFFVDEEGELKYTQPVEPKNKKVANDSGSRSIFARFLTLRAELLAAKYPWIFDITSVFGYAPSLPRVPGIINAWYTPGWEDRWTTTEHILLEFREVTKNTTGNDLTIAFIPSPVQIEPIFGEMLKSLEHNVPVQLFNRNPNRPQDVLRKFCANHGIEFIDTTPLLISSATPGPAYFLREGHLNPLGSTIVGQTIFDSLENLTR